MTDHEKAKAWRLAHNLTAAALSEKTGYSIEAIYWFESGVTPRREAPKPWVWRRYRMACAGVQAEMGQQKEFDWE